MQSTMKHQTEKKEGSIGDSFASLAGEKETQLPARYLDLKRAIIGNKLNQAALTSAWARLTARLSEVADEIEVKQRATIPVATYEDFVNNQTPDLVERIKRCGSVVIRDVISSQRATEWLIRIRDYIEKNPQVKGFPENDKQVYEIYWSKPQQEARSHPRMLKLQQALLSVFATSQTSEVSLRTPLLYSDRLRIRNPGDVQFVLGPHMDGGSIERWEDDDYRMVYEKILSGQWEDYDAWDIEKRATAKQDLYPGPGSTSLFRAWQGWTSLSETGPNEGTLLVYPYIQEHSAYIMMRPLFKQKRPRTAFSDKKDFLAPANWELDLETTSFHGSPPGRGQELNDETHPHLELLRTMIAMPKVYPGDSVWWHSDVIHAVESKHNGVNAAAVMYIPAVALTRRNAEYIKGQRGTFISGRPAPDFPGGVGESEFSGRGTEDDLSTLEGKQGMGLVPFSLDNRLPDTEITIRRAANVILGF